MNQRIKYMSSKVDHVLKVNLYQKRLQIYNTSINITDGIVLMNDRLNSIAWRLHHDFSKEVFDVPVKQIIKSKRTITDITRMSTDVVKKRSLLFFQKHLTAF